LYLQESQKKTLYYYLWRKAANSSLCSNTLDKTSLLESHLTSACWKRVTWSFCILSHSFANTCDLRGRCFIKLTALTATTRTCFKSSPIVFETRTSWRRTQWVVMTSCLFFYKCNKTFY
jgi:hypothetical protein